MLQFKNLLSTTKFKLKEDATSASMAEQATKIKEISEAIEQFEAKKNELLVKIAEAENKKAGDKDRYKLELEAKL